MKNLLKKYYELDEESKEMLPYLYMYQRFLTSIDEYENIKIKDMYDEELLMKMIMKSYCSTDLEVNDIVERLLEALNNKDVKIKDFENMDENSLNKIMSDKEITKGSRIIGEFECRNYHCIFCKNDNKYLLILNDDRNSEVLMFNSLKDIFGEIIKQHIINKYLYGEGNDEC